MLQGYVLSLWCLTDCLLVDIWMGMQWNSIVAFICISLMTEVEYLLMCLCDFFFCEMISFCYGVGLCVLLLLTFSSFYCILFCFSLQSTFLLYSKHILQISQFWLFLQWNQIYASWGQGDFIAWHALYWVPDLSPSYSASNVTSW